MQGRYDQELVAQFIREEQEKTKQDYGKMKASYDRARQDAQVAFHETQENRFEIEELKRKVKRLRILTIIAIAAAVVCLAVTFADEMSQLMNMMP